MSSFSAFGMLIITTKLVTSASMTLKPMAHVLALFCLSTRQRSLLNGQLFSPQHHEYQGSAGYVRSQVYSPPLIDRILTATAPASPHSFTFCASALQLRMNFSSALRRLSSPSRSPILYLQQQQSLTTLHALQVLQKMLALSTEK